MKVLPEYSAVRTLSRGSTAHLDIHTGSSARKVLTVPVPDGILGLEMELRFILCGQRAPWRTTVVRHSSIEYTAFQEDSMRLDAVARGMQAHGSY
jgi:hypothetical protein